MRKLLLTLLIFTLVSPTLVGQVAEPQTIDQDNSGTTVAAVAADSVEAVETPETAETAEPAKPVAIFHRRVLLPPPTRVEGGPVTVPTTYETTYTVTLQVVGDNKKDVIEVVKEAKNIDDTPATALVNGVEFAPVVIQEGLSKTDADTLVTKLTNIGATAKITSARETIQPPQPLFKADNTVMVDTENNYSVVLTDIGNKKVNVIKAVRVATGLGLKEAKDLVDSLEGNIALNVDAKEKVTIKQGLSETEAESLAEKITASGATAEAMLSTEVADFMPEKKAEPEEIITVTIETNALKPSDITAFNKAAGTRVEEGQRLKGDETLTLDFVAELPKNFENVNDAWKILDTIHRARRIVTTDPNYLSDLERRIRKKHRRDLEDTVQNPTFLEHQLSEEVQLAIIAAHGNYNSDHPGGMELLSQILLEQGVVSEGNMSLEDDFASTTPKNYMHIDDAKKIILALQAADIYKIDEATFEGTADDLIRHETRDEMFKDWIKRIHEKHPSLRESSTPETRPTVKVAVEVAKMAPISEDFKLKLAPEATKDNPHYIQKMDDSNKPGGWVYGPRKLNLADLTPGAHEYKATISGMDRREIVIVDEKLDGGVLKIDNAGNFIRISMEPQELYVKIFKGPDTNSEVIFDDYINESTPINASYGEHYVELKKGKDMIWEGVYKHLSQEYLKPLKLASEASKDNPYYIEGKNAKGWYYGPLTLDIDNLESGIHTFTATPSGFGRQEIVILEGGMALKIDNVGDQIRISQNKDIELYMSAKDNKGNEVFNSQINAYEPVMFKAPYGEITLVLSKNKNDQDSGLKVTYQHNPSEKISAADKKK